MVALDFTVLVQIGSFLLFWFLLTRLVFRPFGQLIDQRERRTQGLQAEAASLNEEAERFRAQVEGQIARARDEGNAIKDAIRLEALQARERILTRAQQEAARRLQTAREEIQKELESGREAGAREAEVIAREMAVKVLGRSIG